MPSLQEKGKIPNTTIILDIIRILIYMQMYVHLSKIQIVTEIVKLSLYYLYDHL